MSKCQAIDPLVTPYVDGELPGAERVLVDEHLHRCPPCQSRVAAESAIRDLVRARKAGLTAERPSPALHTRCSQLIDRSGDHRVPTAAGIAPWWQKAGHPNAVPLALTTTLV